MGGVLPPVHCLSLIQLSCLLKTIKRLELQIYQLSVGQAFDGLSDSEKHYAHYMARAAWSGTRIILRQVSPEANDIFDFIITLYHACGGDWEKLATKTQVDSDEVERFLNYAAMFLSNVGNYFGSGDQKILPRIFKESLAKLASRSGTASAIFNRIKEPMFAEIPSGLGAPGPYTQTAYYLGDECLASREDVNAISTLMEENATLPENTRLRRSDIGGKPRYEILQASVEEDEYVLRSKDKPSTISQVRIVKGDHKEELEQVCYYLQKALEHTSDPAQQLMLERIHGSFMTGDLRDYKEGQKIWVTGKAPAVETVIGFVEPYRDPLGVRAEFEGIVGIANTAETSRLNRLAGIADSLVCRLPWIDGYEASKGPFEKEMFEPPDFSSVQSLAYCSSIVFPGINLPNYNDIRQETGHKNIIFSNRMVSESSRARGLHMVDSSEQETFKKHRFHSYYIWIVLHEILGHGTGRFLSELSPGNFNFDPQNPPSNPLTGKPIESWYRPGQTWTGVFEDLATTMDECRAEIVGAYLIDEPEILGLFGYYESSEVTADDVVYNMYLQLSVDGLRGLENYDPITKKWGQAHSRAHYAMLRHLLRDSDGLYTIHHDRENNRLTVQIDRSQIPQKGKPSLGRMLLHLHIYRCTADKDNCRKLYEDLSHVDDEALKWREVVISRKDPPLVFCHANTFVDEDGVEVELREYEPTSRGVIQSWVERDIDDAL